MKQSGVLIFRQKQLAEKRFPTISGHALLEKYREVIFDDNPKAASCLLAAPEIG
ncbi:hypothetical protein [Methylomonas rapida]|uniref:Uncharacterized protein n=1 Tax=Methylomonas rapida TaxID=2963939 RepID=A0ABY7GKS2_9GAMM|nr:hypothetical protein [Methylomonas rapida]WAR45095.1 hypothetical protein NM686_000885 [Methylomonas rapida]